jgi:hypothetical protein
MERWRRGHRPPAGRFLVGRFSKTSSRLLVQGPTELLGPCSRILFSPFGGVPIRYTIRFLSLLLLSAPLASAQSKIEVADLQNHPFSVDFPSGSRLQIELRSGDFRIVGADDNKISVHIAGKNSGNARDLTVRFKHSSNDAELRVSGGPRNELQVTIEVPKFTGLFVRMPAGQLEVDGISGDKDVSLHAGELILSVGNPADYAHVDASVTSGDLEAAPFGESHGGLFRSFHKNGAGKYQLRAHVGAGDLTMR